MNFVDKYLDETIKLCYLLNRKQIELAVALLVQTRNRGGRLFILGVGGSAANASHAVNDFRKILGIEAYTPTDNVAELTARTNDCGWNTVFEDWLVTSRLTKKDTVLVFSVGGGGSLSPNIVDALKYTQIIGATIIGIVSKDGGYTAKVADCCIVIPIIDPDTVTPHAEEFQVILWHLMVNHPDFKIVHGEV